MKPYLEDTDLTLYQGDVREVLATLPSESVHCVVTSPPYWGLRDYGTGSWDGGNPDCDHTPPKREHGVYKNGQGQAYQSSNTNWDAPHKSYGQECGKCGARRVDNQLGLEATPDLYVERMVGVFREVRRVLRRDGTCWVNMGDSYASGGNGDTRSGFNERYFGKQYATDKQAETVQQLPPRSASGLKPKDLCMIPARLALALQADGWWLRSQIVWSKPNPMPESVTDRPTTSHEYVLLLAKSPRYFFDQEAVREPSDDKHERVLSNGAGGGWDREYGSPSSGRNMRSVWEIPTQPYPEAHFATYPEELVRRCILAGTSERGCCPECGAPWTRETELSYRLNARTGGATSTPRVGTAKDGTEIGGTYGMTQKQDKIVRTLGWVPSCECPGTYPNPENDPVPCTVLDPFFGSGTTGLVARKHGRRTIGIELSEDYCRLAARRLQQLSLLAEAGR